MHGPVDDRLLIIPDTWAVPFRCSGTFSTACSSTPWDRAPSPTTRSVAFAPRLNRVRFGRPAHPIHPGSVGDLADFPHGKSITIGEALGIYRESALCLVWGFLKQIQAGQGQQFWAHAITTSVNHPSCDDSLPRVITVISTMFTCNRSLSERKGRVYIYIYQ